MSIKKKSNNKMQNVSFKTVDEFFEFLPNEELKLVEFLRSLVLQCIPNAIEKLSYNVLYFKQNRNICFIWPASILWGNKKTYDGVRFGFTYGNLINDEINYLNKENRKQVYWKDFNSIDEIDVDLLRAFIFEAAEIDKNF